MIDQATRQIILDSSSKLDQWIEDQKFNGYDPHDALNSFFFKGLTFGNRRIGQVWLQLLKRSPINFRPLLGIKKGYNPKSMGLFLSTYARRFQATNNQEDLNRANLFANWLVQNSSRGYHGQCWGYNFDWPNRNFNAPAGTPTVVNTAFIGLSFLDFEQAAPKISDGSICGVDVAASACQFVLNDLNRLESSGDEICLSYTPIDHRFVHNASVLGGWLLSEVYKFTGEQELADTALATAKFTSRRQRTDGAWLYGIEPNDNWIDNFHTGYVLVALKKISENLDINEFNESIRIGYEYWKSKFFLPDGTPKYYPNKIFPIDSHSIAQGILTFLTFSDKDPEAIEWATRVAQWGINHMQDPAGYFYYQMHSGYINRIPYMRWSEAWMQRALTKLLLHIS